MRVQAIACVSCQGLHYHIVSIFQTLNAVAKERLQKIKKGNSEDLENKNFIKILSENITDLNKKIIAQSFSCNQNIKENSSKDVDKKSSKHTNVQ